jgi:long-chain acyl-CoA synthetase
VQEMFGHGPGDDLFVFLPLSLLQQRYWIYSALRHRHDVTVSVYEAAFYALPRTAPTVVMGVPGFYETAKTHIEATARAARRKAAQQDTAQPAGGEPGEQERRAAARTLFGDRIRYLWTGSAPASPSVLRFFTDAGLPIYEGYGLNETCIVSKNHPGAWRTGSVGRILPGKKVLLDENGVVSVRPEHPVNTRYEYCAPGDSERVFAPDGTVRTGDLGRIDEDGFLYILGRADDVIVLANGRKVIVRPIEERMRQSPAIDECVVFCPAESVLVAVVSPAAPADPDAIARHLAEANAAGEPDERISRVLIARDPFTVANGLLSAQFKPARKTIAELYHDRLKDNKEGIHAD